MEADIDQILEGKSTEDLNKIMYQAQVWISENADAVRDVLADEPQLRYALAMAIPKILEHRYQDFDSGMGRPMGEMRGRGGQQGSRAPMSGEPRPYPGYPPGPYPVYAPGPFIGYPPGQFPGYAPMYPQMPQFGPGQWEGYAPMAPGPEQPPAGASEQDEMARTKQWVMSLTEEQNNALNPDERVMVLQARKQWMEEPRK